MFAEAWTAQRQNLQDQAFGYPREFDASTLSKCFGYASSKISWALVGEDWPMTSSKTPVLMSKFSAAGVLVAGTQAEDTS